MTVSPNIYNFTRHKVILKIFWIVFDIYKYFKCSNIFSFFLNLCMIAFSLLGKKA